MRDHRKPKALCTYVDRKCLKCGEQFLSSGDRICEKCEKSNRGLSVLGGRYRPNVGRGKMVRD